MRNYERKPLIVNELQKISFEQIIIIFDNGKVGENPENSLLRLQKNYHNFVQNCMY